jgi:hypothetical protein
MLSSFVAAPSFSVPAFTLCMGEDGRGKYISLCEFCCAFPRGWQLLQTMPPDSLKGLLSSKNQQQTQHASNSSSKAHSVAPDHDAHKARYEAYPSCNFVDWSWSWTSQLLRVDMARVFLTCSSSEFSGISHVYRLLTCRTSPCSQHRDELSVACRAAMARGISKKEERPHSPLFERNNPLPSITI